MHGRINAFVLHKRLSVNPVTLRIFLIFFLNAGCPPTIFKFEMLLPSQGHAPSLIVVEQRTQS